MFWIIIAVCVALDQFTKYLVASHMTLGQSVPLLGKWMDLHYIRNDGASLSILSGQRWLFIVLTVLVVAAILVAHYKAPRRFRSFHLALAFFAGGVLGNFVDRLVSGSVVDFLDPHLWSIFNVADCFITLAVIAICWMLLFGDLGKALDRKKEKNDVKNDKKNHDE